MLTTEIAKKINNFVYTKPRAIDEIAKHINKNWRTANSYVERIAKEQGTLSVRTFREGTRGALKIVFWNNIERIHSTNLQEKLFKRIEVARRKEDFSPSEIAQYIDEKKKNVVLMNNKGYISRENFHDFINFLRASKKQILFFSGNLTFSNLSYHDKKIHEVIEELTKRGVNIKILTRVELAGVDNIKNILAINERLGKQVVEIRHCYQPLRVTIVDNKSARFKEVLKKEDYEKGELKETSYILYEITDKEWIEWLQKVFWNLFSTSISAEERIKQLEGMKKI
jgi:hypothetical protein